MYNKVCYIEINIILLSMCLDNMCLSNFLFNGANDIEYCINPCIANYRPFNSPNLNFERSIHSRRYRKSFSRDIVFFCHAI